MNSDQQAYYYAEHCKSASPDYLAQLLAPLGVGDGSSVLDVGCGTGYVNEYLSTTRALARNLGFDLDPGAIRLAHSLNRNSGNAAYFCASAEAIPLPDASTDHVTCRVVLSYCDVDRAVAEIARVLRPGGSAMLLLHPWRLYVRWLSLDPRRWKTTAAGLVSIALSLWLNATGHQIRLRLGGRPIGETFQSEGRMRAILRRYGMSIYQVERGPEFAVYARRQS